MPKPHEVLQPEAVAPEVVKPGVTRAATSAAEVVLCFMFIASESAVTPLRIERKLVSHACIVQNCRMQILYVRVEDG